MAELTSAALKADVVIIGGGIAGLATAAALSESGLRLALVESRALPELPSADGVAGVGPEDFDSRVSALTARSINFLQGLGVWDAIAARRQCAYRHMTVWDADGTGRIEFDAAELGRGSLGSIVENRLITGALAERVRCQGDLQIYSPARVMDMERAGSGVRITLQSGDAIDCDLLVAADGALSPTREALGFTTRQWDYGHRAIVTTASFERSHEMTAWQRFLPTGPLALLPLGGADDRLCSIVWSIEDDLADELLEKHEAEFAQALTEASEGTLGAVTACSPRVSFPLRQRHALDYAQPGAVLVADAAHTIHPLAGQGINLGLADVEVLGEEISRAVKLQLAPGRIDVLRRYQRRRKGDNLAMMAAMDGFKRLFAQDNLPLRWLRNAGMRGVGAVPPLKRRIIREAMGIA